MGHDGATAGNGVELFAGPRRGDRRHVGDHRIAPEDQEKVWVRQIRQRIMGAITDHLFRRDNASTGIDMRCVVELRRPVLADEPVAVGVMGRREGGWVADVGGQCVAAMTCRDGIEARGNVVECRIPGDRIELTRPANAL
ncbi:MAG: hypothetical protein AAF918_11335 [Pseudomonadota bacterium]